MPNWRKIRVQQKKGTFPFLWVFSHIYENLKKAWSIVESNMFSKKWELSHFYRNFPIFMGNWIKLALLSKATCSAKKGTFPFLCEFSHFYRTLKKACPIVESSRSAKNGNFPIFIGHFPFLWEFAQIYGNFPIFMGIWRKLAALLSKATCSAKNGNFPIF